MLLLKWVFVILHIVTAAAWFGLALPLSRRARLVAAGGPAAGALAEEGERTIKLLGIFAVLTLVFSLVAFLIGGGFGAYGPQYHTSLLLILVLIGVHYGVVRPGWNALSAGDASGQKRVAMGVGIGHMLWLVILVLMFWIRLSTAVAVS
jgi:hypothetical protein